MYSNGFLNMMTYIHTINTSLESNNENDGDVIELITLFYEFYYSFVSSANIIDILLTKQF